MYRSQPLDEFVLDMRDRACKANAPSLLIDKIDELYEALGMEAEIEKKDNKIESAEAAHDDLLDELKALVDAIIDNDALPANASLDNALKIAKAVIERHSS